MPPFTNGARVEVAGAARNHLETAWASIVAADAAAALASAGRVAGAAGVTAGAVAGPASIRSSAARRAFARPSGSYPAGARPWDWSQSYARTRDDGELSSRKIRFSP